MTNNTEVTNLPLSDVKADKACQSRDAMNQTIIDEYAEIMKEKGDDRFPAIVVYFDGTDYWLSEGFHRHAAAKQAGLTTLKSRIRQGTKRDAVLHSVGSNANHGLRRSNLDKRRAVTILLEDEEWSTWSNREIARRCAVDEGLVRKIKEELGLVPSASADNPQIPRTVKRNDTVYEMKTENIGKRDALDEVLSVKPDRDAQLDQPWIVKPDTGTAEEDSAENIPDDEPGPVSGPEEVELEELLSVWDRALEEVQQQFLVIIGVSPTPQVGAGTDVSDAEPLPEAEPSEVPEPLVKVGSSLHPERSEADLRNNKAFEIWKGLKGHTQTYGRMWVEAGCPSEPNPHEHPLIRENLTLFREAARVAMATPEEQAEFLELARAYQAENQYS